MTKLLRILLCFCLASCTTPARSDISITNNLPIPVTLKARAGSVTKRIWLSPHATWTGWVPLAWASQIEIELEAQP